MAARVTIDGDDHLADLNQADPIAIDLLQNGRSRMRFSCLPGFTPARFAEVVAYAQDGATPLYGGLLLQRSMQGMIGGSLASEMSCECVGFEAYLDWCYIDLSYPAATTLQVVLDDLLAALPAGYGITLDATDYSGIPLSEFTWTTMRASDGLRELCDRTGRIYQVSPTKVLSVPLPGGVVAPFSLTDAHPYCREVTWQDAATPAVTTVKLVCGSGQAVYNQTWVADGTSESWVGDLPAAGPGGYHVCTLVYGGVTTYATVDEEGTPGGWLHWDWTTRTLTKNTYPLTWPLPAGTTMAFPYLVQYPFTVTATLGGSPPPSPDIQVVETRPDVFSLAQAQEIADGILAGQGGSPRSLEVVTLEEGWAPGQALTVDLTDRAVDAVFAVTDVTVTWMTPGYWEWTVRATELSVFPGNYLDQWRALLAGSSSGSSTTGISSGVSVVGGFPSPVYLGGSRFHAVQVPV